MKCDLILSEIAANCRDVSGDLDAMGKVEGPRGMTLIDCQV